MTYLKPLIFTMACMCLTHIAARATSFHGIQYTAHDSTKVERLLNEAYAVSANIDDTNWMTFFGMKLKGLPYVAKTLEVNKREQLIINLREVDCTTFVENVVALALCMKNRKKHFRDFCHFLRTIRYKDGKVAYTTRLHYFTQWIDNNTEQGYVSEITSHKQPFSAIQKLDINYMSTHTSLYPMLHGDSNAINTITELEKALTNRTFRYIPKESINNTKLLRNTIKDGDIIAILTSKKGLDTSHLGIALWKNDGLHLLNASRLRGRVVLEPKLLKGYMMGQKSQTGIRVIRLNGNE